MSGAAIYYWKVIAETYGLNIDIPAIGPIPHSALCAWTTMEKSAWTVPRRTMAGLIN